MARPHAKRVCRSVEYGPGEFPTWNDTEAALRGPDQATDSVVVADAFVTVDETGSDVLISESRTVPEILRQVRERALRETICDRCGNPRTRHLRRMRHRHGHERLR